MIMSEHRQIMIIVQIKKWPMFPILVFQTSALVFSSPPLGEITWVYNHRILLAHRSPSHSGSNCGMDLLISDSIYPLLGPPFPILLAWPQRHGSYRCKARFFTFSRPGLCHWETGEALSINWVASPEAHWQDDYWYSHVLSGCGTYQAGDFPRVIWVVQPWGKGRGVWDRRESFLGRIQGGKGIRSEGSF